jgi:glycosyltransferase involved in cell wall biosynthesis
MDYSRNINMANSLHQNLPGAVLLTYNSEKTLPALFKSIERQRLFLRDWVIIDNCSGDRTYSILKEWCTKEDQRRITLHRFEENIGFAAAMNWGLANS